MFSLTFQLTVPDPFRTLRRPPTAQVAELVDALVSGTSGATRGGSSPLLGTNKINKLRIYGIVSPNHFLTCEEFDFA
jgi:hypothetical protein